jgi:hypothetical protein
VRIDGIGLSGDDADLTPGVFQEKRDPRRQHRCQSSVVRATHVRSWSRGVRRIGQCRLEP